MSKIRLFFLIVVFVAFIGGILAFNTLQSPPNSKLQDISELKITRISGNGKIYYSKNPIPETNFSNAKEVNINNLDFLEEIYLRADGVTGMEFYCFGTSFTVMPGTYIYYQPRAKEFYFYSGDFFWNKEVKKQKLDISIIDPKNVMTLSDAGRVRINEDTVEIWNYSGELKFSFDGNDYTLDKRRLFTAIKSKPAKISDILRPPSFIFPEEKIVNLKEPDDSVVRFNWKIVKGAQGYIFRIYSSCIKENSIFEKFVSINRINLDMLQFEEREFYWDVAPVDMIEQKEGMPSKLGHITMVGGLLAKKDIKRAPELEIKSLTVNGNLVIIKGHADSNCELYINDELIKRDMDGSYIHTVTYKSIGLKKIIFRLISPLGIETVEERYVTIFAE